MNNWLERQSILIGDDISKELSLKTIMIVGLGGVGGAAFEALCRVGIEKFIIVDNDVFDETNLNRQILCTKDTLGYSKVDIAEKRAKEINENINIVKKNMFYLPNLREELFDGEIDYIIDAVDTVTAKIDIIMTAKQRNIQIISSMGMGNRIDPTCIKIGDIEETKGNNCGLSKVMRKELRNREIYDVKVVYSTEMPRKVEAKKNSDNNKILIGSISFMPPVGGYFMAAEVVKDILKLNKR